MYDSSFEFRNQLAADRRIALLRSGEPSSTGRLRRRLGMGLLRLARRDDGRSPEHTDGLPGRALDSTE
jgi:hypothetical protein